MMKKALVLSAVLVLGLTRVGWASPILVGPADWEGSRSSESGGGITASGGWADGGLEIAWRITESDAGLTYEYTVSGPDGAALVDLPVNELIMGLSPDVDWTGIFSPDAVGWHDPLGDPATMLFGVRFEFDPGVAALTISFVVPSGGPSAPIWGDFYMRDGRYATGDGETELVVGYNANFGLSPADFSSFVGFIPTPGVQTRAVPEPGTLALLLVGLGLGAFRRRVG
jgi:hypothetical protein